VNLPLVNKEKTLKPVITGVTVSVDIADKVYGNGSGSYCKIESRYPDAGMPVEEIDQCVGDSFELFFRAWKSLMLARHTSGIITAAEFKTAMESAVLRLEKARKYLQTT
jgi:hypothetical protein